MYPDVHTSQKIPVGTLVRRDNINDIDRYGIVVGYYLPHSDDDLWYRVLTNDCRPVLWLRSHFSSLLEVDDE